MGKLKLGRFEYEWGAKAEQRSTFDLVQYQKWVDTFQSSTTGIKVNQENSLKFTGVLSAASLLSSLQASLPKEIYKNNKDGREKDHKDALYKLIYYTPNPYMNGFTFWELNVLRMLLWGNSYNVISKRGKNPIALTPVHPEYVEVKTDKGLYYRVSKTGDKNLDGDYDPESVLHFKDISLDGIVGTSRIILAKQSIQLGISAEKFGHDLFDKGGIQRGHYEYPAELGDQAYNRLKEQLNSQSNHSTPILEGGMKFTPSMINPEAAQFISSREFQLQDVARIFHVPNHLVGDLSRATFSNIEHLDIVFVKYGLRPMAKRMEQEVELKLMPDSLGEKFCRFNLEGILRGDTATRAEYLTKMISSKIMNRNEARAIENLNPVPGGEVFENPNTSRNEQ